MIAAAVLLAQCTVAPAPFGASVSPVTAADLGATWHPDWPIGPTRLRRIEFNHFGFDAAFRRRELIVHQDLGVEVITIFERLYRLRFPIENIRRGDHYPWPPMISYRRRTMRQPSIAGPSRDPANRLHTPSAIAQRPTSTRREYSNRRTSRRVRIAAAATPDSHTRAIRLCLPSPITAGGGMVPGQLLSATNTSSGDSSETSLSAHGFGGRPRERTRAPAVASP
ncbi:hypothetical protein MULP_03661 [Mycobacterium liflandii 128FXT]|uniref:Uncharacterized protein n=1 Tax=Mycobacterium liflandii (strain 128FXT) TaxID=459424 RepID=L7V9R9_MYCL1|nr:hypothetical protein MULP_03661 [Mycobacterium liflandii 128FXT]RFZ59954.1 hypothetical protein BB170200_02758 [Mycobacterium marinum]